MALLLSALLLAAPPALHLLPTGSPAASAGGAPRLAPAAGGERSVPASALASTSPGSACSSRGGAPTAGCALRTLSSPSPPPANWTWGNLTAYLSNRTSPPPRWGAAIGYDAVDGTVVMFGGCGAVCPMDDTWTYAGGTWTNVTPAAPNATNTPSPRFGAALTYDPSAGELVLFGGASGFSSGSGNSSALGDTWAFAAGTWSPLCQSCVVGTNEPGPRWNASFAYDIRDGVGVLFGGETVMAGNLTLLDETWEFSSGTWLNVTAFSITSSNTPPARSGGAMANDTYSGDAVLFGGYGADGALGDTWRFQTGSWTNLTAGSGSAPSPRTGASFAAFNSSGSYSILFGGCGDPCPMGETWDFASALWASNVTPGLLLSPSPRHDAAMAYDAKDGYLVLFGGLGDGGRALGDTWAYPAPFAPLVASGLRAAPPLLDAGQNLSISVNASGGIGPDSYVWLGLPPGCVSANVSNLSCQPANAGSFDIEVNVSDAYGALSVAGPVHVEVNPLPSVSVVLTPPRGLAPLTLGYSATVSGGTAPIHLTWSFGDGTPNSSAPSGTHLYTATGVYPITVRANDSLGGIGSATANVTVAPALLVSARASATLVAMGQVFNLTAQAAGGFPTYAYQWKGLPPGCPASTGVSVTCRPTVVGSYVVSVTAVDSAGNAANSSILVIEVVNPPTPSSSVMPLFLLGVLIGLAPIAVIGVVLYAFYRRRHRRQQPPVPPPFSFRPPSHE